MADGVDWYTYLGTASLAVGALGTASFGIVDGLKLISWVDLAGFERLFSGGRGGRYRPFYRWAGLDPLEPSMRAAYGDTAMDMLKAQYRCGRAKGDLNRLLRQGVRIGFAMMKTEDVVTAVKALGVDDDRARLAVSTLELARLQRAPAAGETAVAPPAISEDHRAAMARLETLIDARIDSALALSEKDYVTQTKVFATIVALVIAFGVGIPLGQPWIACLVVGLVAVPIAPVAKDVASAITEAVKIFRRA